MGLTTLYQPECKYNMHLPTHYYILQGDISTSLPSIIHISTYSKVTSPHHYHRSFTLLHITRQHHHIVTIDHSHYYILQGDITTLLPSIIHITTYCKATSPHRYHRSFTLLHIARQHHHIVTIDHSHYYILQGDITTLLPSIIHITTYCKATSPHCYHR